MAEASPALSLDPYSPALHEDPYPVYARMRAEQPVLRNEELGFWALSRYADVYAALLDPATYISGRGVAVGVERQDMAEMPILIMMDPPRHTRMRALVNRAFTPRRIAELEPRVRQIAGELLDAWQGGPVDLVASFAGPLPTIVIAELLGVPASDREWFRARSNAATQFQPGVPRSSEVGERVQELAAYMARALAERRTRPRDDLLSALVEAEIDGQRLSEPELIGFAFLLLVAGNETTANLIGSSVLNLDRFPDQRRRLLRDPALLPSAVEEFLRFDAPVQGLARVLTRDVVLHGTAIPAGERVLLLFGSANRDERRFPDADRFDVGRDPNPHLAFGFGAHFCLGASLARLEARVAFEELLARHPELAVTGGIQRLCSGPVRGLLGLEVDPGPRSREGWGGSGAHAQLP